MYDKKKIIMKIINNTNLSDKKLYELGQLPYIKNSGVIGYYNNKSTHKIHNVFFKDDRLYAEVILLEDISISSNMNLIPILDTNKNNESYINRFDIREKISLEPTICNTCKHKKYCSNESEMSIIVKYMNQFNIKSFKIECDEFEYIN